MGRERGGPGPVWGRVAAFVYGDQPSPLEMVLGPRRYLPILIRVEAMWVIGVSLVGVVALLLPRAPIEGLRAGAVLVMLGLIVVLAAGFALAADAISPRLSYLLVATAVGGIPVIIYLCGGGVEVSIAAMVAAGISNFVFQRRRVAVLSSIALAVGYALVLALQPGHPAPMSRWLVAVGCMVASSVALAWLVGIVEELAAQERQGRLELDEAHSSLASLNADLEKRVDAQVDEIESLNRLRRFLSPDVAEAVLRDGSGSLLEPHRQQIAVVFCDLRGFTAFANDAAPEEVIDVLGLWFDSLGGLFQRYDATVGIVAGDGVMAYFGDPVHHEDPAGAAVALAVDLGEPMGEQCTSWNRRGFSLGYGVGIAYGYATMGIIGFDRRREYTPLGPTVNLASRLCSAAGDREVLIDDRAHVAVAERVTTSERVLQPRGFRASITAHAVQEWLGVEAQTRGQG